MIQTRLIKQELEESAQQEPEQLSLGNLPDARSIILSIDQKGKCAICNKVPKNPCLDHEHVKRIKGNGKVRGVLCSGCNSMLGKIENNATRYGVKRENLPDFLDAVSYYLEAGYYNLIHPSEAPKKKRLQKSSYNQLAQVCDCGSFPRSGKLTKPLMRLFLKHNIEPKFYR